MRIASFMNVFISGWVTTHPLSKTTSPTTEAGVYATVTFFSPLFGGITNLLLTPLLIYTFSPSSGGHISPTITLATFFARIISFPRMVLYLAGQTLGGAFAGLAMHSAYGSREITVGGCYIDTSMVDANSGLVIEFVACLALIFLAFGTALDPRQANIFGHATAPWFVGIALAIVSWGTAFTREGYIGASKLTARSVSESPNFQKEVGVQSQLNNHSCRFKSRPVPRSICGVRVSLLSLDPLGEYPLVLDNLSYLWKVFLTLRRLDHSRLLSGTGWCTLLTHFGLRRGVQPEPYLSPLSI